MQDAQLCDIAGVEQVWTRDGWVDRFALDLPRDDTGYGHGPDDVAKVRASADLLAGYYHAVHKVTLEYIASVTADELSRIVDKRWTPPVTASARLVSIIDDCAQHLGQAAYVRGIALMPPSSDWWPPIAVAAMLLLGWAVGKGSTPIDDWFQRLAHSPAPLAVVLHRSAGARSVLAAVLAVALYRRRWRLAVVAVASSARRNRRLLDCSSDCSAARRAAPLAYPSGHATVAVVVLGMFVLVAGAAVWAALVAAVAVAAGHAGPGRHLPLLHRHRRALLLGTAIVCVAAQIAAT